MSNKCRCQWHTQRALDADTPVWAPKLCTQINKKYLEKFHLFKSQR